MDMRKEITESIIRLIESGEAKGVNALWDASQRFGMPTNYKTKRPYSGINVPLLWCAAQERNLARNEWLTFKQAAELGGNVKKGSKGVMGVFFSLIPAKDGATNEDGTPKHIPMMKPFWLFNVADVENLPAIEAAEVREFEPIEQAELLLEKSGAVINWEGRKPCYYPSSDKIDMPPRECFTSPINAYAVACHELTHWTGNAKRLNRDFSGKFGSESYAFEELVAEMGGAFLVAHLGLHGATLENHASYIQSWLRVLRNDTSAIFTASKHASAAYNYILEKAGMAQIVGQDQ